MGFDGSQFTPEQRHMIQDAMKYAASDRTDPFAFSRAMTHIKNGIAQPGDYSADVSRGENGSLSYSSVKRV